MLHDVLHLHQAVALAVQVVVGVEGLVLVPGDAEARPPRRRRRPAVHCFSWTPPEPAVFWSRPVSAPSVGRDTRHGPAAHSAAASIRKTVLSVERVAKRKRNTYFAHGHELFRPPFDWKRWSKGFTPRPRVGSNHQPFG